MSVHLSLYLLFGVLALGEGFTPGARPTHAPYVSAATAQGGNAIGGHVFDRQRRPVDNLVVELLNDFGRAVGQTRTSNSGRYEFRGLRQGKYQIRVLTHGTNYISQTKEEEIINFGRQVEGVGSVISGAQYVQIDFVLSTPEAETPRRAPGAIFAQPVPDAARKLFERGVGDLDRGQADSGLADLQKAIEIFPKYFDALERLGMELVKREKYESGRVALIQATEINPRAYQSFYWLGLAQHHLKQQGAAVESLTRAVSLNADSLNAHLWLGIVLRQGGKAEQAEIHLKRAKELGKSRVPEAHWQLALLYNKLGRNKDAADELELFLKAQPDSRDGEQIKKLIQQLRATAK